jgi:hypothetical protein
VYLFGFPQSVYAISGHTAYLFGGWIDILLYASVLKAGFVRSDWLHYFGKGLS